MLTRRPEDLLGWALGFPVSAEEELAVGIDQVRDILIGNVLWGPSGRTFLRHSDTVVKSLEERRKYSKIRKKKSKRWGQEPPLKSVTVFLSS